jgi:hypothetical protein
MRAITVSIADVSVCLIYSIYRIEVLQCDAQHQTRPFGDGLRLGDHLLRHLTVAI